MTQWSMTPVIDWLLHRGRHRAAPENLVAELCARVRGVARPVEVFALPAAGADSR